LPHFKRVATLPCEIFCTFLTNSRQRLVFRAILYATPSRSLCLVYL